MAGGFKINYSKEDTSDEFSSESLIIMENLNYLERAFCHFIFDQGLVPNHDKSSYLFTEVFLISDEEICQINSQYRNKNKATDVISLALYDDYRVDSKDEVLPHINLGDLFISVETSRTQAKASGLPIEQELIELIIHGILHLIGYDHEISEPEMKIMYEKEHLIYDYFKSLKGS